MSQVRSQEQRSRELEAEVLALRQELAALKQRGDGIPDATGAPNCPSEVQAELKRLGLAVAAIQRGDLPAPLEDPTPASATGAADTDHHAISPLAVFLGTLGIFFGFWIGSRYVRKQERGRRSRLRF